MDIRKTAKQIKENVSYNIQKDKKSASKKLKKIGRGRTRRDYRRASRSALPKEKRDTNFLIGGGYGGGWGILFGPPKRRR